MRDELEKQARFFQLGESYFWFASQNSIVERELAPRLEAAGRRQARRPLRIVDLGCGPGNTLRRLASKGAVYGFDFSLDALRFAREKGVKHVLSADSIALPLASESVDCILALDVLEHVEDDRAALAEIARVVRPGGLFLFTVPAFMALWRYHDRCYGHYRRYTREELVGKVRAAGLDIEVCQFFKCAFFIPLWVLAKLERAGVISERDNFFTMPDWVNRMLETEITWEMRSGLARHVPFGVSLICIGRR